MFFALSLFMSSSKQITQLTYSSVVSESCEAELNKSDYPCGCINESNDLQKHES